MSHEVSFAAGERCVLLQPGPFLREHEIEVPAERDSWQLIRICDRVQQIPIGAGCEEFQSAVY